MDIDETLIRQAWKRRRFVWSTQEPARADGEISGVANGKKRKRGDNPEQSETASHGLQADYFPLSFEHMFGPLPIPLANSSEAAEEHEFPHNVVFRTADWVKGSIPEDADGYDIVVAFSISKWIHLNGGDEGLKQFFRRVHDVLNPGGKFILEPQEWETYAKAKRMDARLKENAKSLQLRPDGFERVLGEMGFSPAQHLGKVGEGGFRRPVDLYIKVK